MKLIKKMFGLLLVLTLVFQAVYAKDLSVSDSVLINDDFSSDTLSDYWLAAGTVTYDGTAKALKFANGRLIKTVSESLAYGAYSLSATFNFSTVADVGVLLGTSNENNGYMYNISVSGGKMKMLGLDICNV